MQCHDTRSLWVEVIFLLYHICYSMVEPCIRMHIYETLCQAGNFTGCHNLTRDIELEDAVQKYAAKSILIMKLIRSLPALLIIMFCGAWSDNTGRKVRVNCQ